MMFIMMVIELRLRLRLTINMDLVHCYAAVVSLKHQTIARWLRHWLHQPEIDSINNEVARHIQLTILDSHL